MENQAWDCRCLKHCWLLLLEKHLQILSQDTVILCTKHEYFAKVFIFYDFMVSEMNVFTSVVLYWSSASHSAPTERKAHVWQEVIPPPKPGKTVILCSLYVFGLFFFLSFEQFMLLLRTVYFKLESWLPITLVIGIGEGNGDKGLCHNSKRTKRFYNLYLNNVNWFTWSQPRGAHKLSPFVCVNFLSSLQLWGERTRYLGDQQKNSEESNKKNLFFNIRHVWQEKHRCKWKHYMTYLTGILNATEPPLSKFFFTWVCPAMTSQDVCCEKTI